MKAFCRGPGRMAAAFAALSLLILLPFASMAGEITKKITGDVKVHTRMDDARRPFSPPSAIYIQDFELGYDTARRDSGERGRIVGRVLPRMSRRNDPQRTASRLVELMSESLVRGFAARGIKAARSIPGVSLPGDGWLIRGVFTEMDQGNRAIRAVIGFGAGATEMELYVSISDLAIDPDAPFMVFGAEKDPGRAPGAILLMNPYVAAARFVMQKNASEKDVRKSADRIVEEVVSHIGTLKGNRTPASAGAAGPGK